MLSQALMPCGVSTNRANDGGFAPLSTPVEHGEVRSLDLSDIDMGAEGARALGAALQPLDLGSGGWQWRDLRALTLGGVCWPIPPALLI